MQACFHLYSPIKMYQDDDDDDDDVTIIIKENFQLQQLCPMMSSNIRVEGLLDIQKSE